MNTSSIWFDSDEIKTNFAPLQKNISVDVAIVGGGITGIISAYYLAKAGQKVALFERSQIGSGETSYSTAFLSSYTDLGFGEIQKTVGKKDALLVAQSSRDALESIAQIVAEEKLSCEFQRVPFTLYATDQNGAKLVLQEIKSGEQLGFAPLQLSPDALPFPSFGGMRLENQATFQPRSFIRQLALKLVKMGVDIFENSSVESISTDSPTLLSANTHTVKAKFVVAATHTPITSQKIMSFALRPDTTYVIAGTLPSGKIPVGLYIDTNHPYHYLRITPHTKTTDQFVFGGEDHWTGDTSVHANSFAKLEAEFRQRFFAEAKVTHQWGGQVFESLDGLPYIGFHPFHRQHLFSTGYAGDGLTWSVAGAKIMSDLITQHHNPYVDVFTPRRLRGWPTLLEHGQEIVTSLIHQKSQTKKELSAEKLTPGEGQVVSLKGKRLAMYKDEQNVIHHLSAKCTHLGCEVEWNHELKSWDCPCHGSRFTPTGDVMSGPAVKPLHKM